MAINRFSRGPIAAEYIPLPLDLIDRQLERRQTQYDKTKAMIGASQDALYGVKGTSPDREVLGNIVGEYDRMIEDEVSKVKGDYSRLSGISDSLAQKISKDMKSGHLGAIHNNFIGAQNHLSEITKLKEEGKISEEGYNKGLESISAFGGTVEDGKGGYTKAAFYTPTKFVELGELGDTYSKTIHEQYTSGGEKYLNANHASEYIYMNLYNNPQARENAKEQVWAMGLDPEEDVNVRAYLKKIAQASGNKLAFKQRFKPQENPDPMTGGVVVDMDIISAKPEFSKYKIGGESLNDRLNKLNRVKTGSTISRLASASFNNLLSVMSPQGRLNFVKDMGEAITKPEDELQSVYKSLEGDEVLVAMAESVGFDLKNEENQTEENLKLLSEKLEAVDKQSSNTRTSLLLHPETQKRFEESMTPLFIKNANILNVRTGEFVTDPAAKEAMLANSLQAGKGENGKMAFAGEQVLTNQHYPPGSWMFSVFGDSDYAIIPKTVNNPDYLKNKAYMALTNGISEFVEGGERVQWIRSGENSIKEFRNGKYKGIHKIAAQ